jgi:hypothetical protein
MGSSRGGGGDSDRRRASSSAQTSTSRGTGGAGNRAAPGALVLPASGLTVSSGGAGARDKPTVAALHATARLLDTMVAGPVHDERLFTSLRGAAAGGLLKTNPLPSPPPPPRVCTGSSV